MAGVPARDDAFEELEPVGAVAAADRARRLLDLLRLLRREVGVAAGEQEVGWRVVLARVQGLDEGARIRHAAAAAAPMKEVLGHLIEQRRF